MVRITVHERNSEAFDYSRASTPVAKAYELLDDYFCDDTGALSKDAVEKVLLTFRNDRGFYDRSKLKAIKSYSLAWDALLREIQATLEWDDEFPHATKLSSEQVKNWFKLKGRDFKEDLKPLVDAIDKQRKAWWGENVSNKSESNQETEVSKLVKAYVRAVNGVDAVPTSVEVISTTPIDDDGSVLIEFEFKGDGSNNSTDGITYALVYGDLYQNRDNDLLYFLHDWHSGEKVTPEDIEDHDWVLANDYIRPSKILAEEFKQCEGSKTPEEEVLRILNLLKDDDLLAEYIDMEVAKDNIADLVEKFEGHFDFDTDRGSFVATMLLNSEDEKDDDSVADKWNRCAELTDTIMELFDIPNDEDSTNENWEAIQWILDDGIAEIYTKDESKKSESIVTDLTNSIQQNKPEVLLSDDAVTYFNDYDEMLDAFEGAYQTIIHIENKHGSEEMWFIYEPDDNIIAIGDFDVDRADAERAKELMEKFVRGELEQKPGNDEYLVGLDYIAIADGNNYTSTAFVEKE